MKLTIFIICLLHSLYSFTQTNTTEVEFDNGIKLIGIVENFDEKEHLIDTCKIALNQDVICLIDGEPWFGSDLSSAPPKNQLVKLSININNKEIDLNVTGMFNPNFNNIIRLNQFSLEKCNIGHCLNGYFSDGAGTYVVQWMIIKGKSMRTLISSDEFYFR